MNDKRDALVALVHAHLDFSTRSGWFASSLSSLPPRSFAGSCCSCSPLHFGAALVAAMSKDLSYMDGQGGKMKLERCFST